MRSIISTAVAIAVGIVILLGYFLPNAGQFQNLRNLFLYWGIALAGTAGLVAIINLLTSHLRKLRSPKDRDFYSFFLIVAFLGTVVVGLLYGPNDPIFQKIVTSIQVPIEATLMGMLAIGLGYASVRLLQRRQNLMGLIFVISALVFLVILSGFLSIGQTIPVVRDLISLMQKIPLAGARGILLGVALGSLTTGLRILLGSDRPYSG